MLHHAALILSITIKTGSPAIPARGGPRGIHSTGWQDERDLRGGQGLPNGCRCAWFTPSVSAALADFGRGISRRIVPKRNPTFRWRLGPRGGLQSWKGIEWARGGQAHFSDPGRQSRRDSPCPAHSHIQQASLGRLPAHVVSNSGDWSGVLIASPSVHNRNGLRSTMLPRRTFLVRFKCIMSGPSCRFRTWDFASDRSEAKSNVHAV